MHGIFGLAKDIARKSIERDRSKEPYVEAASRSLWPWHEWRLLAIVGFLAVLDYVSTYAFLELSGNRYLSEGGLLANWALKGGGFLRLFWVDMAAVSTLVLLAITTRFLYSKFGFQGFGRTAFVLILVPYVVITMAVIFNNILLTFL